MKYILSIPKPATKFIEIVMQVQNILADKIYFQLPAWRPGRYELGNFAKNIQQWKAFDEHGNELKCRKLLKDQWEVETEEVKNIFIKYNYYASQLDAGGCWLDVEQLYVNPVHCFLFVEERRNEACEVELKIPEGWKIACALCSPGERKLFARNYDELVDSPFIVSPSIKTFSYQCSGKSFTISFQGDCNPDLLRIEKDFKAFTEEQIKLFGDFPADNYHFLVQVLPYKFYHGVEHLNSTVLAIGPGNELMNDDLYSEFIGVASHELFHVWNVKTIRPVEMLPYDYTKENYSQLGFVYEGFTTYYGDLILSRTGFFSLEQYLKELNVRLQKHMDNYGRFIYSVAQSSFDTWLDGYVPGIPNRKTSIYDEGSLIALMLDFIIREKTSGRKSLDDVMRSLFNDFGKKKTGYTEMDIIKIADEVSGSSCKDFFDNFIYKAVSYDKKLSELLIHAGLEIKVSPSAKSNEKFFGFRTGEEGSTLKIISIVPGSPADNSTLMRGDEIISVNGIKPENNLNELCNQPKIILQVLSMKKQRQIILNSGTQTFFNRYEIVLLENCTGEQKDFLESWLKK